MTVTVSATKEALNECYICKNTFKSKNEMMLHRKEVNPEKVRFCNNLLNCGYKACWYKHKEKEGESLTQNETIKKVVSEKE